MKSKILQTDLISLVIAISCLLFMYLFPNVTRRAVKEALAFCVESLVPSLFPFMCTTRLAVHFGRMILKKNNGKTALFGLSSTGILTFCLGLVSGFPTGAVIAGKLYGCGHLHREEAERIAMFSSVMSPAFCIVFFGSEIAESKLYGLLVYCAIVISSIIAIALYDHMFPKNNTHDTHDAERTAAKDKETAASIIADSFITIIRVCAFVTFFMCIGEVVLRAVSFLIPNTPSLFKAVFSGILEASCGVKMLGELPYSQRLLLGAVILGFGGLSATMQVRAVCSEHGLCCNRIIYIKAFCAIIVPPVTFGLSFVCSQLHKLPYIVVAFVTAIVIIGAIAAAKTLSKNKNHKKSKLNY